MIRPDRSAFRISAAAAIPAALFPRMRYSVAFFSANATPSFLYPAEAGYKFHDPDSPSGSPEICIPIFPMFPEIPPSAGPARSDHGQELPDLGRRIGQARRGHQGRSRHFRPVLEEALRQCGRSPEGKPRTDLDGESEAQEACCRSPRGGAVEFGKCEDHGQVRCFPLCSQGPDEADHVGKLESGTEGGHGRESVPFEVGGKVRTGAGLVPGQLGHEQPRVGADLPAQQDQAAFLEARLQDGQGALEERLFDVRLAEEDHHALDTSRREGLLKGLLLAGEIGCFRRYVEGGPVRPGGLPMAEGLPDRFRCGLFEGSLPVQDDDGETRLGGQGFQRRECTVGATTRASMPISRANSGVPWSARAVIEGIPFPPCAQEDDLLRTGGLFQSGRKGGGRLADAEDPRPIGDDGRRRRLCLPGPCLPSETRNG